MFDVKIVFNDNREEVITNIQNIAVENTLNQKFYDFSHEDLKEIFMSRENLKKNDDLDDAFDSFKFKGSVKIILSGSTSSIIVLKEDIKYLRFDKR